MYLEHFHLQYPPFAQSDDPELFFPQMRMERVAQSLVLDILAGKPLLKLVGDQGSGKTLLCRILDERLPEQYQVVTVAQPKGSFEELSHDIFQALAANTGEGELVPVAQQWRQLLAQVQEEGAWLLLIIDAAEKMFTATVERLLRLVTEEIAEANLTLLLVGRPELDERLAQMAALGTAVAFNASYQLEPFSESDTRQYLRHRCMAAGMSREHVAEVFTEPVLAKILATAQGHPRLINTLGEEALQNFCAEKSFMVLLDHVEPDSTPSPQPVNRIVEFYELLMEHKRITLAAAGVMVLILVGGLVLTRSGRDSQLPPATMAGNVATPNRNPAAERPTRDGEAVFRERLGASAGWLAGMYKGGYTIQLMMLASTSAEYSLADTLVQDDYYPLRDQFYILRKLSKPPTLFVFYGVYDSLEAAREARNSMPAFLRKFHPYPLAISEAMRKIEQ